MYRITWLGEGDVPDDVRAALPSHWRSFQTNGNGACALHAVFGKPNSNKELFAPSARAVAFDNLHALPEASRNNPVARNL